MTQRFERLYNEKGTVERLPEAIPPYSRCLCGDSIIN